MKFGTWAKKFKAREQKFDFSMFTRKNKNVYQFLDPYAIRYLTWAEKFKVKKQKLNFWKFTRVWKGFLRY